MVPPLSPLAAYGPVYCSIAALIHKYAAEVYTATSIYIYICNIIYNLYIYIYIQLQILIIILSYKSIVGGNMQG